MNHGWIEEDNIYRKLAYSSKGHFMNKAFNAIGLDVEDFEELADVVEIRVLDVDTNTVYKTTPAKMKEKGFEKDFGYNPQIFLTMENWETYKYKK